MAAMNTESFVGREIEGSKPAPVEAPRERSYRAPEKRLLGDLELMKGRNFNDDKDRGNENYYR